MKKKKRKKLDGVSTIEKLKKELTKMMEMIDQTGVSVIKRKRSALILMVLTENDGDVVKVLFARDQAVRGSNNKPGDLVTSDPHQTYLISPVVDERSRTAVGGPGGRAVQPDEGRPGELS